MPQQELSTSEMPCKWFKFFLSAAPMLIDLAPMLIDLAPEKAICLKDKALTGMDPKGINPKETVQVTEALPEITMGRSAVVEGTLPTDRR